ncbi:RNA-binding S4 domain-containing protein [Erythrobacter sp. BLCC-B19]|uniref:RNA-binding S4 domain-containing protein n=1 Tax=Erythrobacter sp. BLCC-B19 TaxID=3025315 RepID=UPI002361E125|nr:RNA-binding S4 domain-containing protein [Erythrobacter sp. BLCC-B19]WDA42317.1 RNA-binding S4 domain-containing protein [Erythrobacter sp. BLCC-B19]
MTGSGAGESLRADRLLVYLRFARTRSAADALIAGRGLRRNRQHVARGSEAVRIGDVLTLMVGGQVRVIELLALPARRGSPAEARSHYREVDAVALDPMGQLTIAASPLGAEIRPADPEDRF